MPGGSPGFSRIGRHIRPPSRADAPEAFKRVLRPYFSRGGYLPPYVRKRPVYGVLLRFTAISDAHAQPHIRAARYAKPGRERRKPPTGRSRRGLFSWETTRKPAGDRSPAAPPRARPPRRVGRESAGPGSRAPRRVARSRESPGSRAWSRPRRRSPRPRGPSARPGRPGRRTSPPSPGRSAAPRPRRRA